MFDFIKNLFTKKYPLGALKNPPDNRHINTASFQKLVTLPVEFISELPPVKIQGQANCVGFAIAMLASFYFKRKGIDVDLSGDDLYLEAKKQDGIPDQLGTYPVMGAKIAVKQGVIQETVYKQGTTLEIVDDRKRHRLGGYAFVSPTYNAICQAIYQNGAVTASFYIDIEWFRGIIGKVLEIFGQHYIIIHGFGVSIGKNVLYGQNTWGVQWIGRLAGSINPKVKPGQFETAWVDVSSSISDIMVFADIPQYLIDEARGTRYFFTTTLRFGSQGYEVRKLQERLNNEMGTSLPLTGSFLSMTKEAVENYQIKNGLKSDGVIGAGTRKILNG